jgi:hypothetical protein
LLLGGCHFRGRFVCRLFERFKQCFGLGHQFGAQLICAPALPAFQLCGLGQCLLRLDFKLMVQGACMGFQSYF